MEEWRSVVGFESWYGVSDQGRVRRIMPASGTRPGRVLKPLNRKGHYKVNLSLSGKVTHVYIHHLVIEAFVGPRPEGCFAHHINGDPLDNRIENLAWVDSVKHFKNAIEAGRPRGARGEQQAFSRLTEKQVLEIRRLYAGGGYTYKMLGEMYGVTKTCIGNIIRRKTWKHI